jgi:Ulp1 family protease
MYSFHLILMIIQVDNSSVMVFDSLRKNPASYQNLQDMFQV